MIRPSNHFVSRWKLSCESDSVGLESCESDSDRSVRTLQDSTRSTSANLDDTASHRHGAQRHQATSDRLRHRHPRMQRRLRVAPRASAPQASSGGRKWLVRRTGWSRTVPVGTRPTPKPVVREGKRCPTCQRRRRCKRPCPAGRRRL